MRLSAIRDHDQIGVSWSENGDDAGRNKYDDNMMIGDGIKMVWWWLLEAIKMVIRRAEAWDDYGCDEWASWLMLSYDFLRWNTAFYCKKSKDYWSFFSYEPSTPLLPSTVSVFLLFFHHFFSLFFEEKTKWEFYLLKGIGPLSIN